MGFLTTRQMVRGGRRRHRRVNLGFWDMKFGISVTFGSAMFILGLLG